MPHQAKATYLLLLCYEWVKVDVLFDLENLPLMLGVSAEVFAKDWEVVRHKFTITEGGCLHNERLETLRNKAKELSEKRREYGKSGGLAKASSISLAKAKLKSSKRGSKGRLKTEDRRLKIKEVVPEALVPTVEEWLTYKEEQGQVYKDTGLKQFLGVVRNRAAEHGDEKVTQAFQTAMANGYKGFEHKDTWNTAPSTNGKPTTHTQKPLVTPRKTDDELF